MKQSNSFDKRIQFTIERFDGNVYFLDIKINGC